MKQIRITLFTFAAAALLLNSCGQPDMEVNTTVEVPVGVIEASTSSIEEFVSTTGSVYPSKEVTLSSEITGEYRLQINPATGKKYALGDYVKAGATIIKLEDEEYVNDLRIKSLEVDEEISGDHRAGDPHRYAAPCAHPYPKCVPWYVSFPSQGQAGNRCRTVPSGHHRL